MQRFLRLFLCLPLLATTACAADAIAGPEIAPEPEAVAQAAPEPEPEAASQTAPALTAPSTGVVWRCRASTERPTEPLYIVDGVVVPSLAGVDNDDVESIEVLKGNVAASLYGSRAARGVIIVTTRGAASRRS
jgi:TonB-dependent SusC/RagA subfamily outer membrane receptor